MRIHKLYQAACFQTSVHKQHEDGAAVMVVGCRQRLGSEAGRAGSLDGRKAVFRNREQEANDPDFQRGFNRWGGHPG